MDGKAYTCGGNDAIESGQDQCAAITQAGDWYDEPCSGVRPFTGSRPL